MDALEGIRVVDFGHCIAGPMTGMLLADHGAQVVKVDPPGGPRIPTPADACWNRGKRSITLDLKLPADVEIARRLAGSADVVIENFRPGVMERLGLGAEALQAADPRLVYCSIPGFGADDPRSSGAAWEGVVSAACGLYRGHNEAAGPFGASALGSPVRVERSDEAPPVYTPLALASCTAASLAATSIAMSLYARERDGVGERIEVSLFDALYGVFSLLGLKVHGAPDHPFPVTPWIRPYRCADGRWLMLQVNYTRDIDRFLRGLGLDGWHAFADRAGVQRDAETATALLARLTELMRSRSAEEWQEKLSGLGLCASLCYSTEEWLHHPHARESGMVLRVDGPDGASPLQPGIPVHLSETPGRVRAGAPRPDADRAEILAALEQTPPRGHPPPPSQAELPPVLAGVRVLDLCIVLAGPTCGRVLAEFGADVIKIDEKGREGGESYQLDVNRGKRSIHLDLKSEEGLGTFWRLAAEADVVVEGFRQGVVERLGIGYEDVRKRVPDVIYASINCYGERGPWSDRPGFEQLAQAASGMQERFGDGTPYIQAVPINDYGTGFNAAFAIALALRHRLRTGRGQHVFAALARTAVALQASAGGAPRGQDQRGDGARHRLYRAADGWFFLGAGEQAFARLLRLEGFRGLEALQGPALERALEERFRGEDVAHWTALLAGLDIGAQPLRSIEDAMGDPVALAHGVSLTREHPGIGRVRTHGPSRRQCLHRPLDPGRPAGIQGCDTEDVVRGLWEPPRDADHPGSPR